MEGFGGGPSAGFGENEPGLADFEAAMDAMDREIADRAALSAEREQDRPGRFGVTSEFTTWDPTARDFNERGFWSRVAEWGVPRALSFATNIANLNPLSGLVTTIGQGLLDKALGKTEQEIDLHAGRNMLDVMTGGMFTMGEKLGTALQAGAKAVGMTGGPQPGFGEQGPGVGAGPEPNSTLVDRNLAQRFVPRPYDPYSPPTRPEQIEQLLRTARRGRA